MYMTLHTEKWTRTTDNHITSYMVTACPVTSSFWFLQLLFSDVVQNIILQFPDVI